MSKISVSYADLPQDVRDAVEKSNDRTGVGITASIAFFLREGLKAVPNPAPWNIAEQEPLPAPDPGRLVTHYDQFLIDVFNTAIEGGVTTWANVKKYHWTTDRSNPLDNEDHRGFYAIIVDSEDDDAADLRIDRDLVALGVRRIRDDAEVTGLDPATLKQIKQAIRKHDAGEIDAGAADIVIQVGLFDEVVYG